MQVRLHQSPDPLRLRIGKASRRRWVSLMMAMMWSDCMLTSPQIRPSNLAELEQLESREEREQAYIEHSIYPTTDARGTRYIKGTRHETDSADWKGLDLVLRSDAKSAAVLPERTLVTSRIFSSLALTCAVLTVAGVGASAHSGINLSSKISGPAVLLVAGGVMTFGFGLGSGISLGKAQNGYRNAVKVYNDSLARRLGM